MRLDELFSRLAVAIIGGLASGKNTDDAIKSGLISSLAHQIRKDVTPIPDNLVNVVEDIASNLVLAEKFEREVTDTVTKFQLVERQAVTAQSNILKNPQIGVNEGEALRAVAQMQAGVSDGFNKLEMLKASVLKR